MSVERKVRTRQSRELDKKNYVIIRNFIDKNLAVMLGGYLRDQSERAKYITEFFPEHYRSALDGFPDGDHQAPGSFSKYNDRFFDSFSHQVLDKISAITGRELIPTYNYSRIYYKGNVLNAHVDRPSCEISASICLDYDSHEAWEFFLGDKPVTLNRGDMVIYMGEKITHSRPELKGKWHAQLFLHFNDINGPYKMINAYEGQNTRWYQHYGILSERDEKFVYNQKAQVTLLRDIAKHAQSRSHASQLNKIADDIEKSEK